MKTDIITRNVLFLLTISLNITAALISKNILQFIYIYAGSLLCLAIALKIDSKVRIISKGKLEGFDIIGNEERLGSRGIPIYSPVIMFKGKQKTLKKLSHIAPFLVGGKVRLYVLNDDYIVKED